MRLAEIFEDDAPRQVRLTDEFLEWFAGSKIVDFNGRPLVVYHGSPRSFGEFDKEFIGSNTDHGYFGRGFYFTNDPDYASDFALQRSAANPDQPHYPNVRPCYLRMLRPYRYEGLRDGKINRAELSSRIREAGHDGIIKVQGYINGGLLCYEYVVFDESQIRSALVAA